MGIGELTKFTIVNACVGTLSLCDFVVSLFGCGFMLVTLLISVLIYPVVSACLFIDSYHGINEVVLA